jgi:hypothetical protein
MPIRGKVHPGRGHECPDTELRYSSTFSLTLALDRGRWLTPCPSHSTPWYRLIPIVYEAWMGSMASLDGCGQSCPHWDSTPGPSSPKASQSSNYAIPAHTNTYRLIKYKPCGLIITNVIKNAVNSIKQNNSCG